MRRNSELRNGRRRKDRVQDRDHGHSDLINEIEDGDALLGTVHPVLVLDQRHVASIDVARRGAHRNA